MSGIFGRVDQVDIPSTLRDHRARIRALEALPPSSGFQPWAASANLNPVAIPNGATTGFSLGGQIDLAPLDTNSPGQYTLDVTADGSGFDGLTGIGVHVPGVYIVNVAVNVLTDAIQADFYARSIVLQLNGWADILGGPAFVENQNVGGVSSSGVPVGLGVYIANYDQPFAITDTTHGGNLTPILPFVTNSMGAAATGGCAIFIRQIAGPYP